MTLAHTADERLKAAQDFIAKWAAHKPGCVPSDSLGDCSCGFHDAIREYSRYQTVSRQALNRAAELDKRLRGMQSHGQTIDVK